MVSSCFLLSAPYFRSSAGFARILRVFCLDRCFSYSISSFVLEPSNSPIRRRLDFGNVASASDSGNGGNGRRRLTLHDVERLEEMFLTRKWKRVIDVGTDYLSEKYNFIDGEDGRERVLVVLIQSLALDGQVDKIWSILDADRVDLSLLSTSVFWALLGALHAQLPQDDRLRQILCDRVRFYLEKWSRLRESSSENESELDRLEEEYARLMEALLFHCLAPRGDFEAASLLLERDLLLGDDRVKMYRESLERLRDGRHSTVRVATMVERKRNVEREEVNNVVDSEKSLEKEDVRAREADASDNGSHSFPPPLQSTDSTEKSRDSFVFHTSTTLKKDATSQFKSNEKKSDVVNPSNSTSSLSALIRHYWLSLSVSTRHYLSLLVATGVVGVGTLLLLLYVRRFPSILRRVLHTLSMLVRVQTIA